MKVKNRMDTCPKCKRKFPTATESKCGLDLVTHAFIEGKHILMCPLCYGASIKTILGIEWNPMGESAKMMFEEAKELYPNE